MQLDRELQQEENDMISEIISRNEDQRKDTVNMMTDGLAGKLQGDLKDSQIKDILDKYEKDLDANMSKFSLEKEKQLQDLRRKLAEKRRRKEALLREKHNKEVSYQIQTINFRFSKLWYYIENYNFLCYIYQIMLFEMI